MLWVAGRVVPDGTLAVPANDRTFEHGLGLFETLRTWRGKALLLDRHLDRLRRSADVLGIGLQASSLPDAASVAALLEADPGAPDRLLRITLSGGQAPALPGTLWMRAAPLPAAAPATGIAAGGFWQVATDDPLARHKTLNYWRRRLAFDAARARGLDECLSRSDGGLVWEGSRTNLFSERGGTLFTPPLEGPIVPGVMRALVIELARRAGIEVVEQLTTENDLAAAGEAFLTNSVRGIVPVARLEPMDQSSGTPAIWQAPGALAARLQVHLARWIETEGGGR